MDTSRQRGDDADMAQSVSDMEATPKTHPITVQEFNRMFEAGIYGPDARIELVDGCLIDMPPQDPPHFGTVTGFQLLIQRALQERALVRGQGPLPISTHSQPEPDLALVRWDNRLYRDHHPTVDETYAVVEIAYSSLAFDRAVKRRVYGAARIPEYWVVDVQGQTIEIWRNPNDLGYGSPTIARRGDTVAFAAFPDVVFTVDELLG
jgi:Uma2 family endonuclease